MTSSADMLVDMLRSLGGTSICDAGNGKQALEMLHGASSRPVDVALCDLNMPEMDGMEFLRHLGQAKRHRLRSSSSVRWTGRCSPRWERCPDVWHQAAGGHREAYRRANSNALISANIRVRERGSSKLPATFTLEEILQGMQCETV